MELPKISLAGFSSQVRGLSRLCDEKEIYSIAVTFATATCQTLKGLRRKEVYSGAVAFATATCQFLEVYFKYSLFFRIFISYCITITYKNTHISFYIF